MTGDLINLVYQENVVEEYPSQNRLSTRFEEYGSSIFSEKSEFRFINCYFLKRIKKGVVGRVEKHRANAKKMTLEVGLALNEYLWELIDREKFRRLIR